MPFKAYELYKEYEPDKYQTSIQKKVERALQEAKKVANKEIPDLRETREIFENDFIGIEETEKFIGRPLSADEKRLAEEKWQEKAKEQNLTKKTFEELKKEGFMIVLRVPDLYDDNEKKNIPVTILNLKKKFPLFYAQDWYEKEEFAKEELSGIEWGIVKKEILERSRGKNWDEQEKAMEEWAEEHNIDPQFVHRRKPTEVVYDVLVYFNNRGQRILEKDWDWTSTCSSDIEKSDKNFIQIGFFNLKGLDISHAPNTAQGIDFGVCPAR